MNKHILLGIATLLVALLYACPADGGSTSGGPAPEPGINIEEEIKTKDPALVYKADTNEEAQALFSRGDLNNPYLFSFGSSTVKNLEAITGEITITSGDTVLYEETKGAINPFGFDARTDIQTSKTMEGMYMLDTSTVSGAASIDAVTDDPSYDGTTYIVGIGPDKDNPIDYDALTDEFTVHVKILHAGEVLKEETVQVSKAPRYDVTTWRDLQRINDDLTGNYEVQNDIVFPEVGAYGYDTFHPIGLLNGNDWRQIKRFTGTFEGNNHKIEGLYVKPNTYSVHVGLFGIVKASGAMPAEGMIRNIHVYHVGIHGDGIVGGLIGQLRVNAVPRDENLVINNCHVYALRDAKVKATYSLAGGLIGWATTDPGSVDPPKAYIITEEHGQTVFFAIPYAPKIQNSSAHTDVEGIRKSLSNVGDDTAYTGNVGGLIGGAGHIIVENSYATGNVVGNKHVGGLIGRYQARASENAAPFIRGYATGDVTGTEDVGGLIGRLTPVSVAGYATGKVSGNRNIGGAIGRAFSGWIWKHFPYSDTVINVYTTGDTVGDKNVGGVVGYLDTHDSYRVLDGSDKGTNVITYTGYARGQVSSSASSIGVFAGVIGGDEEKDVVSGYHPRIAGNTHALNQGTGINGGIIFITEVNDANYKDKFKDFVFSDEAGQWTWEGEGKWPAINIGDLAPTSDQPIISAAVSPYRRRF